MTTSKRSSLPAMMLWMVLTGLGDQALHRGAGEWGKSGSNVREAAAR
jgi:hypothetical protein